MFTMLLSIFFLLLVSIMKNELKIFVPLYDNAVQILTIEDYLTYHGFNYKYTAPVFRTNKKDGYKKLCGFVVCLH